MDSKVNQIAAEAANELEKYLLSRHHKEIVQKRIQAAIEKAMKEHDKEQHYYAALGEAESRAAHLSCEASAKQDASEPDFEINMRPIEHKRGGQIPAAHASEK